jgi:hypothetical protein
VEKKAGKYCTEKETPQVKINDNIIEYPKLISDLTITETVNNDANNGDIYLI